jgi:hypothetical protein
VGATTGLVRAITGSGIGGADGAGSMAGSASCNAMNVEHRLRQRVDTPIGGGAN